jgi:hypothetical protein
LYTEYQLLIILTSITFLRILIFMTRAMESWPWSVGYT